jgi:hypothetical protein
MKKETWVSQISIFVAHTVPTPPVWKGTNLCDQILTRCDSHMVM